MTAFGFLAPPPSRVVPNLPLSFLATRHSPLATAFFSVHLNIRNRLNSLKTKIGGET